MLIPITSQNFNYVNSEVWNVKTSIPLDTVDSYLRAGRVDPGLEVILQVDMG